jgi:hypothetical protein
MQINLFAEHVSVDKASQVGMNFMKQKYTYLSTRGEALKMYKSVELTPVTTRSVDNQHFYVFNLNDDQGWVLVADDDRCTPILAYSKSGKFVTENLPANIEDWLVGISSEVQYIIDNNIVADNSTSLLWKELFNGVSKEFINRGEKVVNPLVQTRWDQAPYYNALCPYDNMYGERTVTGCVATAMAQVLKYWNYPEVGNGSHSYSTSSYGTLYANFGGTQYEWNNMPNRVTSTNNAVATLMYHCGVSVDMSYGVSATGGSGAYVISSYTNTENCAEFAFKNYFGYKSSAHGEMKDNTSDSQWKSMLRADLDASRPLVYAGFGNGGHCFVCDGYDNSDMFHFNWGWDGQNNGFYSLSALNPGSGGAGGGSYSFTNNQQAIFGLEPDGNGGGGGGGGGSTSIDLRLYSELSVDSQIWFGSDITVTASIGNWGDATFNGSFCAAAFDADGNFIDFIDVESCNLQGGYYMDFEFTTTENMVFVPGQYQVALFLKTNNEDWTIVDDGNYNNYGTFEIYYYDDIETYSNFDIVSNNGRLIQGSTAKINVDVANTGNSAYYGKLRVNLSTLSGEWVQNIEVKNVNEGLSSGYYYSMTFEGVITAEPGTYHMELAYYNNGWFYAGAYYSSNPITVVVEAPELNADQYEVNNTQAKAYKLVPTNWTNDQTTIYTTGSNLHVGNDVDYYKIELPTGGRYSINARLHDSYDSGNGQEYTVDAMFAYSTDGQNYSAGIDDVMDGNITMNGGTIYFAVTPYFSGMSGTYLLQIHINRNGGFGVDDDFATNLILYPNPVKDILHVRCDNIQQYDIFSVDGKLIKSSQTKNSENAIDCSDLGSGIYIVRITTNKGVVTRKIIKE